MAASCLRPFSVAATPRLNTSGFSKPLPGLVTLPSSASSSFSSQEHCPLSRSLSILASLSSFNGRAVSRLAALAADPFDLDQTVSVSESPLAELDQQPWIQPQGTKLYVGNLPWSVDSQQLAQVFQDVGGVEMVEVIYDRETGRSRGFAFVTMSTAKDATTAIERLDGADYEGRMLRVNVASGPRSGGSPPPRFDSGPPRTNSPLKMFVGNLPWTVDDEGLEQIFSDHGKVQQARVMFDRETGRSRGFGFVTLSTEAEVTEAIASLDGLEIDGRPIRVNLASDRPASRY